MKSLVAFLAAVLCVAIAYSPAKAGSTDNLTGKWHFVLETDDGERIFEPTFHLEGDQVTGKWGESDVKGTFANEQLDLEFPANSEEVGPGTLKIKGKLAEGALSGTWAFQEYSGTFKATRSEAVTAKSGS
jgi:hypothetical protein